MVRTRAAGVAAGVLAAVMLAACGGADGGGSTPEGALPTGPLSERETVTVALAITSPQYVLLYAAIDSGAFEAERLDVNVEVITSADAIPLLGRGMADVMIAGPNAGLFTAINQGINIRWVSAMGTPAADSGSALVVRKDLYDSGEVTSLADLAGREVALPTGVNSQVAWLTDELLQQDGLTLADVVPITLSIPDQIVALRNGTIDIGYVGTTGAVQLEQDGVVARLGDATVFGGQTRNGIFYGPSLIEDRPQVGVAFMRALQRTARDHLQGDYYQDPVVWDSLLEWTEQDPAELEIVPIEEHDRGLEINVSTVEEMQAFFVREGLTDYDEPVPVTEIIDDRYRTAALESLG